MSMGKYILKDWTDVKFLCSNAKQVDNSWWFVVSSSPLIGCSSSFSAKASVLWRFPAFFSGRVNAGCFFQKVIIGHSLEHTSELHRTYLYILYEYLMNKRKPTTVIVFFFFNSLGELIMIKHVRLSIRKWHGKESGSRDKQFSMTHQYLLIS